MVDTLLSTSTVRQIDDLSEPYVRMKPRKYPTATLMHVGKGKPPISEKEQWGELEAFPISTQVNNGAGYSDSATTIVVDDTTGWQAGMDVMIHRTREIITIGAVDSSTQISSCTRGARGTTAAAIVDNDVVLPLSVPRAENYAYSGVTPRMQQASEVYNYLQLWAEGVAISNTEQVLMSHGGKAFGEGYEDQVERAIENIKKAANTQVLWGIRSKSSLTRTAGGILQYAYTKDYTSKDITDRKTWETTFGNILKWVDGDLIVPCSFTALQAHQYALQGADPQNATGQIVTVAGVEILKMRHFLGGWVYLYYEPSLPDDVQSGANVGICMPWVKGQIVQSDNRPIGRYKVPPTTDGLTEQVQLETTWKFKGSRNFAVIGGIQAPA